MSEINHLTCLLESQVEQRTEELKTAHRKLLQTDRLASLGQLAASVAHEINNPISGVLNLSMLMQRILKEDGIPPNRIEDFRKYLSQVISETSRVGRIIKVKNLQRENAILRKKLTRNYSFHDVISKNSKMHEIFNLVRDISYLRSTVLIQGESGTGKELIARSIHPRKISASSRATGAQGRAGQFRRACRCARLRNR